MADGRASNGGARPGAGRKPRAEKYERPINRAEKQIVDRLPAIVAAQIQLALGVTVQETDAETGGVTIYTKAPDQKAAAYLIDRILGKPTARIEAETETTHRVLSADQLTDDELAAIVRRSCGAAPPPTGPEQPA